MSDVKAPLYTDKYLVGSVDAAFSVLEHISKTPDQTLQDIAASCQQTVSQTNRLLHTLRAHGYVLKTPLKRYRLGYGSLNLGHHATAQFPLIEYAGANLDQVLRETQESVHLVQRVGTEVVILDVRESPQHVRVVSEIGTRGPLQIGGSGRIYLAYDDPRFLEEILQKTALEQGDPARGRLTQEINEIRTQGYSVARGDFEADAFSVACPLFGFQQRIIGTLAIAGPLSRLSPEHEARLITSGLEAARRIERLINNRL